MATRTCPAGPDGRGRTGGRRRGRRLRAGAAPAPGGGARAPAHRRARAAEHRLVTAAGVTVDDATLRAASRHAVVTASTCSTSSPPTCRSSRCWPSPARRPARFRDDPLATGYGADHALLVTEDVLARSRHDRYHRPRRRTRCTALIEGAQALRPAAMAHAVAPGLSRPAPGRPRPAAGVGRVGLRHGLAVHPARCGRRRSRGWPGAPVPASVGAGGGRRLLRPAAHRHRRHAVAPP